MDARVVLEKVIPVAEDGARLPLVTAGKRACPPEDCGGIWGFHHLLKVLADPDDPEYADLSDWLGREFDADAFDIEETNEALEGMARQLRWKA